MSNGGAALDVGKRVQYWYGKKRMEGERRCGGAPQSSETQCALVQTASPDRQLRANGSEALPAGATAIARCNSAQ